MLGSGFWEAVQRELLVRSGALGSSRNFFACFLMLTLLNHSIWRQAHRFLILEDVACSESCISTSFILPDPVRICCAVLMSCQLSPFSCLSQWLLSCSAVGCHRKEQCQVTSEVTQDQQIHLCIAMGAVDFAIWFRVDSWCA